MEKQENKLQEQQAPLKNSDRAFVQVGHGGEPVFPKEEVKKEDAAEQKDAPPQTGR